MTIPHPDSSKCRALMSKGGLKLQLGLFYVIEMMAGNETSQPDHGVDALGYALFDLQHRQLTEVFCFFEDVLTAARSMALA